MEVASSTRQRLRERRRDVGASKRRRLLLGRRRLLRHLSRLHALVVPLQLTGQHGGKELCACQLGLLLRLTDDATSSMNPTESCSTEAGGLSDSYRRPADS